MDLIKDNWYYTQVFTDTDQLLTITFARTPDKAKERVHKWLDEKGITGRRDIHLYHKNYKREAKKMLATGNFIS